MNNFIAALVIMIGVVALVAVLGLILALPVMWLWNGCLVPAVAGVREVSWLQSWGLIILFGILFKSSTTSK